MSDSKHKYDMILNMKLMKPVIALLLCLLSFTAVAADDAQTIIAGVNKKFAQVADYTADAYMAFNIPGVKIKSINGKAFYKKPDKFRIKAKGIFFLPKQNMSQHMNAMLADTRSYTPVLSGYEQVAGTNCAVINIIPLKTDGELIIAKLWIDPVNSLILHSQVTTKSNGTIETFNTFGANAAQALPSRIEVRVETGKFKVPKMFAADINKNSSDKAKTPPQKYGTILISFSNYRVNTRLQDAVFTEKEE
jgi:hypothetical protein